MSQASQGLSQHPVDPLARVLDLFDALVTAMARPASLHGLLDDTLRTAAGFAGAAGGAVAVWAPGASAPMLTACCGVLMDGTALAGLKGDLGGTDPRGESDLLQGLAVEWGESAAMSHGLALLDATSWLTPRGEYGFACLVGVADGEPCEWRGRALKAVAGLLGHAIEQIRLAGEVEVRMAARDAAWASVYDLAVALTHDMDTDRLLDAIVRRAIHLLDARAGVLSQLDEATGDNLITVAYLDGEPAVGMLNHRMPAGAGLAGRVIASGEPVLLRDCEFVEIETPPHRRTSLVAVPLLVQGRCVGVLAAGDDASARAFTQDDVQTLVLLAQQAGLLLAALRGRGQEAMLAVHRERARLARGLHDGLAQNLASLLMKAELCSQLARGAGEELECELDRLATGLQSAIRETRTAIFSLHEAPSTLQALINLLRLVVPRYEEHTGVQVTFTCEGPERELGSHALGMALLSVAQEALTNALKHANATQVRVCLNLSCRKKLELHVEDDGSGFDLERVGGGATGHFGVSGMRSCVEELGGSLQIDSKAGRGTTVTAIFPLGSAGGRGYGQDHPAYRG